MLDFIFDIFNAFISFILTIVEKIKECTYYNIQGKNLNTFTIRQFAIQVVVLLAHIAK